MKKIIAVVLSVIMIFGIAAIAASAVDIETYDVVFADLPYDISPFREDYVGKYMGYEYGVDYWFTITNEDGTTTDIKGLPYSVPVYAGDSLEFTVSVADYIEPSSAKVLVFPTELDPTALYDEFTGAPYTQYYISDSVAGTYGVRPSRNITITLSEFDLFNDAFLCNFPQSKYYTTKRVQYNEGEANPWDEFSDFKWGNTKVIFVNETLFFEVRIPLDDPDHKYHFDTYQVYYTTGTGNNMKTIYLKTSDETDMTMSENWVAHYDVQADPDEGIRAEQVDVFAIPNVDPTIQIKVTGTVTYTMSMLKEFFQDFDLENLDDFDWDSVDFSPIVEYVARIIALILKILAGFGLSIKL